MTGENQPKDLRKTRPTRKLDRIDCEILAALQKNARLSNKELAAKLGVAQSTCLERVRRMAEERVLRGFHARLEPRAVGVGIEAMISVRLNHSLQAFHSFRAHALSMPEVVSFFHLGGENDFLVHVAVRDAEHLRQLALTGFTERHEVARIETALIFEHLPKALPIYVEEEE